VVTYAGFTFAVPTATGFAVTRAQALEAAASVADTTGAEVTIVKGV
jgi:hypothetical protein